MANMANKSDWVCWNNDAYTLMLNCGVYKYMPEKIALLKGAFKDFMRRAMPDYNIVIDGTNINVSRRKSILTTIRKVLEEKNLSENLYDTTCVNFGPGTSLSLNRRLADSRGQDVETWRRVHESFRTIFEVPTIEENFTSIVDVGNF